MLDLQDHDDGRALVASVDPAERFAWLIKLRWYALAGIVLAALTAAFGIFPGVNWHVLAITASVAAIYNGLLWRAHQHGRIETDERAAMTQALGDFLLLTIVLWASGGVRSPFIGYYAFHIALAGLLAGPRATLLAAAAALCCAGFLWLAEVVPALRISEWRASGVIGGLTDVGAFASTALGIAYLVTHAVSELRDREEALGHARDQARFEYEVLSTTLHELDAGLEIVDSDNQVVFKNRLAQRVVPSPARGEGWHCPGRESAREPAREAGREPAREGREGQAREHACERDASGLCPLKRSFELGEAGRCRFAASVGGVERIYEMHSFPLASAPGGKPKVMNLYVDRTAAMLAERQLVLAERLSSLGRIAQGVAHELNTPLATIRTLAADMSAALSTLRDDERSDSTALLVDLDESATLIHEETGRLGRITQALLAGGDLVRARIEGAVTLSAVVQRGCALVLAGARRNTRVDVDPSIEGVLVEADPDRLLQVIVNLLQNACDAVRNKLGGKVSIVAHKEPEGMLAISVEDDGPGIDPSVEAHLFEPFATTKPPGEGTGLGLYTSYMLAHAMRGTLTIENRKQGGARATLRLPLTRRASQPSPLPAAEPKRGAVA